MNLNIIVCCKYSGERSCLGSVADLDLMTKLLLGEQQIFDDISRHNLEKFSEFLEQLPSQRYKKIIFYFSGHASDGILEIGSDNISLDNIAQRLQQSLLADGDLFLLCDCCTAGDLGLPFDFSRNPIKYRSGKSFSHLVVLVTAGTYQTLGSIQGSLFTQKLVEYYRPDFPITDIINKMKPQVIPGLYLSRNVITSIPLSVNYRIFTDDTLSIKYY